MSAVNIYGTIKSEVVDAQRIAVKDGLHSLTYAALFERVDCCGEALREKGIGTGTRVALFCGDCIDYVVSSLAVLSVQAVVVPVAPSTSTHELEALVKRVESDFLLYDAALSPREGERLQADFIQKEMRLEALNAAPATDAFLALNPAFVRFSSGTTGASKGVLLSHEAILERTAAADRGLEIMASDTVLWVLSMSFHFVVSILLFLRRGATIWLCYDHFPLGLADAVKSGEGTFMYAAPFHYYTLCVSGAFQADGLKRVRMAISTSMKLPEETATAFEAKFGFSLSEAYGIIEVGLPFLNRNPGRVRESVGQVLPDYELALRSPDATGVGEVWLRGRGMFNAYVSPWKVFEAGSWFESGDLGRLDEAGNLQIVGRTKNVINFMGMKVFPYEVEAVLGAHPAVEDAVVYGEAHPRYGQLPAAKVVLRESVCEETLIAYAMAELASYKVPKRIAFVEVLPRTASGKLVRA